MHVNICLISKNASIKEQWIEYDIEVLPRVGEFFCFDEMSTYYKVIDINHVLSKNTCMLTGVEVSDD